LASRREFIVDRLDLSLDGFDDLQFTDILGVKIVCHKFCLYMFLVYIHPKSTLQEYDLLFQLLGQLNYIQGKNVMILGDFNIPAYTLDMTITSIHDSISYNSIICINCLTTSIDILILFCVIRNAPFLRQSMFFYQKIYIIPLF
jgi:hypothetical protein